MKFPITALLSAAALCIAAPPVTAESLAVFTTATTFCEKRALGMPKLEAYRFALNKVASNPFYDKDYLLPNFPEAVANAVYDRCPQYMR